MNHTICIFFVAVPLVFFSPLLAQGQEREWSDSAAVIEKLRTENFRLKLQVRELQSRLDRKSDAAAASGGISSLDTFDDISTATQENTFFSLVDRWDDLSTDNVVAERATITSDDDRRNLLGVARVDTLLHIPHDGVLQKYIDIYTMQRKTAMMKILGRYDASKQMFLTEFRRQGIPDDITLLCIIESAVNVKARSRAGAAGLWQLMPETARNYGLKVAGLTDERFDAKKSTTAAARILRDSYREFGDWGLVLMSYNCGRGRIRSVIEKCGDDISYENLYRNVPRETREYLPAFVAALYVNANRNLLYDE